MVYKYTVYYSETCHEKTCIEEQSLFFLNPKCQGSNNVLWLYSSVSVGTPEDRVSHYAAHSGVVVLSSSFTSASCIFFHVMFYIFFYFRTKGPVDN